MSLSCLPDELLMQITGEMDDTKILARLCLCSRRFSRVARPALYSCFRQNGPMALPLFLRTILSEVNGHLALHVRKYVGSTRSCNRLDMSVLTVENRARVEEVVRQICDIQQPGSIWLIWLYGRQNWDAVTALTLMLLPNLGSIDMVSYGSENCYPFIQNVLSRASRLQYEKSRSLFGMHRLHSVFLEHHDVKSGLGMHYVMPFLNLRSVKVFKGRMISDANYQGDPDSTFDTDEVSIKYSNLDAVSLQRFLRHFTCLKKFEYEHAGTIIGDSDLVPMAIGRGVSHLTEYLQELDITNWDINWILSDDADSFDPIQSLAEFRKLEKIEATAYVLLGKEEVPNHNQDEAFGLPWYNDEAVQGFIESLPVSLEHLTIKDCSVAIFDCLAKWLEEGIPPKLKTVKIIFNPDYEMEAPKREGCLTGAELENIAFDRGVILTRHECFE